MLGLDGSGKTTITYQMKLGEIISTLPTIGFNVEQLNIQGATFNLWDIGGQEKIRPLWKHYFEDIVGLIYVIDSTDKERMDLSKEELFKLL
jgi:small GTP-binding protein